MAVDIISAAVAPAGLWAAASGRASHGNRYRQSARPCRGVGEADEVWLAGIGLDLDVHACGRRVDHVPVADDDADVAGRGHDAVGSGEEHEVPGPYLDGGDALAV